ncbi:MAG TPA: L,D-transpeptidase [Chthoniobacterales bacterium]|nr:L,D-transpeptidase [Chthoniobacterales bacterium]
MQSGRTKIDISLADQRLTLTRDGEKVHTFPISSSRFGIGTEEGSLKTPVGNFRIAEKIGHGAAPGTIFKARVPLGPEDPLPDTEDFVTTRILWLDGVDPDNANTRERYIYIHGTKHEDRIGTPDSHGCIRMRDADVIKLFELVDETTQVVIRE